MLVGASFVYFSWTGGNPANSSANTSSVSSLAETTTTYSQSASQPALTENESSSTTGSGSVGSGAEILGTTMDPSLAGYSIRNEFQAEGLTWLFYTNGTDLIYQSQNNGTWSTPSYLRPQTEGYHFALWYDAASNVLYYASVDAQNFPVNASSGAESGGCAGSGTSVASVNGSLSEQCLASGFWYRWGTPEANGTISWLIPEGFVQTGIDAANPYIYGNGSQIWVSLLTGGGSNVEVWHNDGTSWNRVLDMSTTLGTITVLTPLRDGLAMVYFNGYYNFIGGNRLGVVNVITTTDGGETWSNPVTTSFSYVSASVLAIGDTVYLVGVDGSAQVRFWSYGLGNSTMSEEVPIASNATSAFITSNGSSGFVLVYTNGQSIFSMTSLDQGRDWESPQLVSSSSGAVIAPLVVPYEFQDSQLPICWTTPSAQQGAYDVACTIIPA